MVLAFIATYLLKVNIVLIILGCAIIGITATFLFAKGEGAGGKG